MKNEELYRMITDIDDSYILEAQGIKKQKKLVHYLSAVAALFACIIGLLNLNPKVAYAMGELPLVGNFFELVTFQTFEYQRDTIYADVKIPKIQMNGMDVKYFDTVERLNREIKQDAQVYIDQIMEEKKGHKGLDISYDLIENSDRFMTVRLNILQTSASGYNQVRYYHMDKIQNRIVNLKDLFKKDVDYLEVLSNQVKSHMKVEEQKKGESIYLDDFKQIEENQSFYLINQDTLVLVFDEYDITPGYYGVYEVSIPLKEIEAILK